MIAKYPMDDNDTPRRDEVALPVATWEGSFTVYGVRMRCYVVNGVRIINAEDVAAFCRVLEREHYAADGDLEAFAAWQKGQS